MLEYDTRIKDTSRKRRRIDISEGIDVNKTSASVWCDIVKSVKSVIFVTTGILKLLVLSMNHIFAMVVMM